MDKTIQVQAQIRRNAEEVSSFLTEMKSWEQTIKKRDTNIKKGNDPKIRKAPRVREGAGTVAVASKQQSPSSVSYVSALAEAPEGALDDLSLTPSMLVEKAVAKTALTAATAIAATGVPKARGVAVNRDAEEAEREKGNMEFKTGNFRAAIKSYTKCLGLKSNNYIAFSNRAMAYLKLKEFGSAQNDCTCALRIEPAHVKSLLRRASALGAQGKLRAAVRDLLRAQHLDPASKQVRTELQHAREQLRSAVNRAPTVSLLPQPGTALAKRGMFSSLWIDPALSAEPANPSGNATAGASSAASDTSGASARGEASAETCARRGEVLAMQGPDPVPRDYKPLLPPSPPPPTALPTPFAAGVPAASSLPTSGAGKSAVRDTDTYIPPAGTGVGAGRTEGTEGTGTTAADRDGTSFRIPISADDDDTDDDDDGKTAVTKMKTLGSKEEEWVGGNDSSQSAKIVKDKSGSTSTRPTVTVKLETAADRESTECKTVQRVTPSLSSGKALVPLAAASEAAAQAQAAAVAHAAELAAQSAVAAAAKRAKKASAQSQAVPIQSTYELERALLFAGTDESKLRTLFASARLPTPTLCLPVADISNSAASSPLPKKSASAGGSKVKGEKKAAPACSAKAAFSVAKLLATQALEPTVVFLLLRAVGTYFAKFQPSTSAGAAAGSGPGCVSDDNGEKGSKETDEPPSMQSEAQAEVQKDTLPPNLRLQDCEAVVAWFSAVCPEEVASSSKDSVEKKRTKKKVINAPDTSLGAGTAEVGGGAAAGAGVMKEARTGKGAKSAVASVGNPGSGVSAAFALTFALLSKEEQSQLRAVLNHTKDALSALSALSRTNPKENSGEEEAKIEFLAKKIDELLNSRSYGGST